MANAAKLAQREPVRMMMVGYPGAGKTGSLASLVDAGFKIRYIDFEGNYSPMLQYSKPENHGNVDIVSFRDELRNEGRFITTAGIPKAFADALKLMGHWKYTDTDGTEVDLGIPRKDWGPDTIVVVDSLTSMGQAAFRRAQSMLNKTPLNTTQQVWGVAMSDQEQFIEWLVNPANRFHVIIMAHLKMISPKDIAAADDEITKDLKERAADIVPTRLFPSALGQQLPPQIGGKVPTLLLVERIVKGGKVKRVIRSDTGPELDTKLPSKAELGVLDIEDGLVKVFNALLPGGISAALTPEAQPVATEKGT